MAKIEENILKINERVNNKANCQNNDKVSSNCQEFCQLIGKREAINNELSKREDNLRRRLEMLECWMPAVTMMKIMKSGYIYKPDEIGKVIDKQTGDMTITCLCPSPKLSQHEDIRVRELEVKRKKAARRLEEAKRLLTDKQTAVEEQSKKIEEAKRKRACLEEKIKELEGKISLANNLNKNSSIQSITSIGPDELMYLTKLEDLVKSEEASRKQLENLEKRQEMYIKALETAGDIWKKEEHHQEVDGLKSQLEIKSSANQQLADRICQLEDQVESLKCKLTSCNEQLLQFTDRKSVEVMLGTDITYRDIELSVHPDFKEVSIIYDDTEFNDDKEIDATPAMETRETSTFIQVTERAIQESLIDPSEHVDAETTTEQQFVSLPVDTSDIEVSTKYDISVPEIEAKLKIVKFDVSTQTTIDCICVDIRDLQLWARIVNEIRRLIIKCDTCKKVKPGVDILQEAISQLLGIKFVENDEEYAMPADGDTLVTSVDEYQSLQVGMEVSKIDKEEVEPTASLIEMVKDESKLVSGGRIDGSSITVDPSTPKGSVTFPIAMSTPIRQVIKKISSERIIKNRDDNIEKITMIPEEKEDELDESGANDTSHAPINMDNSLDDKASHVTLEKQVLSEMKSLEIQRQRSHDNSSKSQLILTTNERDYTNIDDREINEIDEVELQVVYVDEEEIGQEIIGQVKGINEKIEINKDNEAEDIGELIKEASELLEAKKVGNEDGKKIKIQELTDEIGQMEGIESGGIEVKEITSVNEIEAKEIKQSRGEVEKIDENGSSSVVFTGGEIAATVAVPSKSTVGTDRLSLGSSKIHGSSDRLPPQEMTLGDVLCTAGGNSQGKHEDLSTKCPVTSRMSVCICHALRRWPKMTRRQYEESKEAVTKIPPVKKQRRPIDSKTVSSVTIDTIETQTRIERISDIPSIISQREKLAKTRRRKSSDDEGDMCDPCECDPCTSVSTTSSETNSIQPIAVVEKKDQAVMAKMYKTRR